MPLASASADQRCLLQRRMACAARFVLPRRVGEVLLEIACDPRLEERSFPGKESCPGVGNQPRSQKCRPASAQIPGKAMPFQPPADAKQAVESAWLFPEKP